MQHLVRWRRAGRFSAVAHSGKRSIRPKGPVNGEVLAWREDSGPPFRGRRIDVAVIGRLVVPDPVEGRFPLVCGFTRPHHRGVPRYPDVAAKVFCRLFRMPDKVFVLHHHDLPWAGVLRTESGPDALACEIDGGIKVADKSRRFQPAASVVFLALPEFAYLATESELLFDCTRSAAGVP